MSSFANFCKCFDDLRFLSSSKIMLLQVQVIPNDRCSLIALTDTGTIALSTKTHSGCK